MFLFDQGSAFETTRSPTLTPATAFSMRGDLKLETPAVFCATWMHVTLAESWDDRTCSVVVNWTWRSWQLAEHRRCDKTREGRKHTRGEKRLGDSSLLLFLDLSRVSSVGAARYPALHVLSTQLSVSVTCIPVAQKTVGFPSFKLRRIASLI